jgi:methionyl-tRNA formyltransferase
MIEMVTIAGDGAGALVLYKGLIPCVKKIFIHTNTCEIFKNMRKVDEFTNELLYSPTKTVICSAYAPIIDTETLREKEFLNIHYAPLPKYRGMHPIVWGIINNENYLGWTLHKMDQWIDSGPIIYQYKVKNDYKSSSIDYMNLFHRKVQETIGATLLNYLTGKIRPTPQDKKEATWGIKRNLLDCRVNFSYTHKEIVNLFRALVEPYPLPFIEKDGVKYFIKKYKLHNQNIKSLTLGTITNIDDEGVWIKVSDGYLVAQELCNNKGEVINRTPFKIGTRLDKCIQSNVLTK